ncbi:MarR family winged helix-turn-helix transcriptional regulator [Micromonospora sp. NPDC005324]|uniref:MarR family winged helix-turn-helix transcriptional regulator n=1 Tax=Micromonospora sp. NPDC005324 TaxID=3157033 RepID=UPI0033A1A3C8
MSDAPEPVTPHALFKVLAALAELGDATAAAVADKAGLGYSTATAKLRALEHTGQAESIRTEDKRSVWRLTDAGRTSAAADRTPPPAADTSTDAPDVSPAQASGEDLPEPVDTFDAEPPTPQPTNPTDAEPSATAAPPAASTEPDTDAGQPDAADDGEPRATASQGAEPDTTASTETASASSRRAKGSLRAAVLDILEAHPDRAYKTGELCKLIDAAEADTGVLKARPGAVVNAAVKLVGEGKVVQTVEKPATFQLAPAAQ